MLEGLLKLGPPLVIVNGNAPDDPGYPMTMERTIGRFRVGMLHNLDARRQAWAGEFDVVIHGHTHRAGMHRLEVDGRRCERWVLPDWYGAGGYLEVKHRQPRLIRW